MCSNLRKKLNLTFLISSTFLFVFSCEPWRASETITQAVWSDDNTEVAYILSTDERQRQFPSGFRFKNEKIQLFKTDSLLKNPTPITEEIEGQANILFYMKQAGYIIAGLQEKDWFVWDLDGKLLKKSPLFPQNIVLKC